MTAALEFPAVQQALQQVKDAVAAYADVETGYSDELKARVLDYLNTCCDVSAFTGGGAAGDGVYAFSSMDGSSYNAYTHVLTVCVLYRRDDGRTIEKRAKYRRMSARRAAVLLSRIAKAVANAVMVQLVVTPVGMIYRNRINEVEHVQN